MKINRVMRIAGALLGAAALVGCDRSSESVEQDAPVASPAGQEIMSITSHWTEVGGSRVHYLAAGPDGGRRVVLLHGGRFRADTWKQVGTLELLAAEGNSVVAVDLPGHGRSPSADVDRSIWLGGFLHALEIEGPVIVSPSMSGSFSLPLVTGQPSRVAGFVAVAPVAIQAHREMLDRITVPTLAIWGENDSVVPLADADLLVKLAAEARKVVIPGAGHALYMDDAEAFHTELVAFLKSLD